MRNAKPKQHVKSYIQYENPDALDLLNRMLQFDPKNRITAEEAIQHKYFEEIHDPEDIQLFEGPNGVAPSQRAGLEDRFL